MQDGYIREQKVPEITETRKRNRINKNNNKNKRRTKSKQQKFRICKRRISRLLFISNKSHTSKIGLFNKNGKSKRNRSGYDK